MSNIPTITSRFVVALVLSFAIGVSACGGSSGTAQVASTVADTTTSSPAPQTVAATAPPPTQPSTTTVPVTTAPVQIPVPDDLIEAIKAKMAEVAELTSNHVCGRDSEYIALVTAVGSGEVPSIRAWYDDAVEELGGDDSRRAKTAWLEQNVNGPLEEFRATLCGGTVTSSATVDDGAAYDAAIKEFADQIIASPRLFDQVVADLADNFETVGQAVSFAYPELGLEPSDFFRAGADLREAMIAACERSPTCN